MRQLHTVEPLCMDTPEGRTLLKQGHLQNQGTMPEQKKNYRGHFTNKDTFSCPNGTANSKVPPQSNVDNSKTSSRSQSSKFSGHDTTFKAVSYFFLKLTVFLGVPQRVYCGLLDEIETCHD